MASAMAASMHSLPTGTTNLSNDQYPQDDHETQNSILKRLTMSISTIFTDELTAITSEPNVTPNAVPVAVVNTLIRVIELSTTATFMHLVEELDFAIKALSSVFYQLRITEGESPSIGHEVFATALKATHLCGIDSTGQVFRTNIWRTNERISSQRIEAEKDFNYVRERFAQRGKELAKNIASSKDSISALALKFIPNNSTIMVHGHNEVLENVVKAAKKSKSNLKIICFKGTPFDDKTKFGGLKIVRDAAASFMMEKVDMVLTGSFGVCENGGVMNKMGGFNLAIIAKSFNIPFYVVAESFKFTRLFPISQHDLANSLNKMVDNLELKSENSETDAKDFKDDSSDDNEVDDKDIKIFRHSCLVADFTPPEFITLLFTDLGVLTPSAVSEELIRAQ